MSINIDVPTAHAVQVGISKEAASFLLSIVGVTNTVVEIQITKRNLNLTVFLFNG